jgi:hypothetical protein
MTDQHRATPEQWEHVQISAGMKQQIPWATADCLLELRSRIEALEAAQLEQAESNRFCTDAIVRRVEALEATQQDKLDRLIALDAADPTPDPAMDELHPASAEAQPGGLMERVANAIYNVPHDSAAEASAAIREVAKWLRDRYPKSPEAGAVAFNLCQEADRG